MGVVTGATHVAVASAGDGGRSHACTACAQCVTAHP